MKAGAMVESKWLKKEDLDYDNGNLVTIAKLKQENVGKEDDEEIKWIMYFREFQKGLVLNSTNIQLCAKALNDDETDNWEGKKIVLYVDDNVSFGGKLVGGIRIRRAKVPGAQQRAPAGKKSIEDANRAINEIEDDVPF